jgi:hypothetical protein
MRLLISVTCNKSVREGVAKTHCAGKNGLEAAEASDICLEANRVFFFPASKNQNSFQFRSDVFRLPAHFDSTTLDIPQKAPFYKPRKTA